ncbi:hypothetical protein VSS74_12145 [Conexibacter stalactiti]|uniref:Uncharacterized protein n=1 Tax=Conexibacter stalactiti TaxID=1940611 RepID=A0ABU4HPC4_9ACTN|nr:hypothetical protein [Conexibacter stalactiti]MDW5595095.1 hypothetical protein [Conexibacter stalactiti]MEC5035737.1 hypothetical protein [Conexibacter stalactiti]
MGLLDDAIREHLELKRRRGADPTEVARAEQEALGPVRREPEPAPVQDSVHEEPHDALPHEPAEAPYADVSHADAPLTADHGLDDAHEPAPPAHEPAAAHDDDDHELAPEEQTRILPPEQRAAPAEQPEAPFADEHAQPEPPPHAEPAVHEQPAAETATPPHGDPAHDEPAVDPRHSDIVHQPTTEWRIEDEDEPFADERPEGEAASDEDVLEETPDFLQETPEHDRLWFEQRPPRDFDFDD